MRCRNMLPLCLAGALLTIASVTATGTPSTGNSAGSKDLTLFGIDADASLLVTIDPATGKGTEIGQIGVKPQRVNGLAVDADGRLYSSLTTLGAGPETLWVLDRNTGEGTFLMELDGVGIAAGITFGPDGFLYGVDSSTQDLYKVDLATEQVTIIGQTWVPFVTGLAYGPDSWLYAIDGRILYRIDPATAESTEVGRTNLGGIEGISFDENGVLYATDSNCDCLSTLDLNTGAATVVGDLGFSDINDIVFAGGKFTPPAAQLSLELVGVGTTYEPGDTLMVHAFGTYAATAPPRFIELKVYFIDPAGIARPLFAKNQFPLVPGYNSLKEIGSYRFDRNSRQGMYSVHVRLLDPVTGDLIAEAEPQSFEYHAARLDDKRNRERRNKR